MTDIERVAATRRVAASAADVFALVSDPAIHVRVDGSGMLVAPVPGPRPQGLGDVFEMDMDRTPLGDLPGVTTYRTANTVTAWTPGRHFAWTVGMPGRTPIGYEYGYLVRPVEDGVAEVTLYFDWSGMRESHKARSAGRLPLIPVSTLAQTLERLDAVVQGEAVGR